MKCFASDNNSGVDPKVMEALVSANNEHVISYGADGYTEKATQLFRENFETDLDLFFVYNGTGANIVALQALTQSFGAIICTQTAHINVDECGAPEKATGCKLIDIPSPDGKLTVEMIEANLHGIGDQHHSQPAVVSITQSTELGTLYTLKELKQICDFAHTNGMSVHLDGTRIANAAAALGCSLADVTWRQGVDIMSFGGTKNGLMFGEAVVSFDKKISQKLPFIRKQSAQLHSKMRFIAAQYVAYLSDKLWLKNAIHSNKMATLLSKKVAEIEGISLAYPTEVNAVFAKIPPELIEPLQDKYFFYVWDEHESIVRWMTSFDTTEDEINNFIKSINEMTE